MASIISFKLSSLATSRALRRFPGLDRGPIPTRPYPYGTRVVIL
jgi:hypothetical protein